MQFIVLNGRLSSALFFLFVYCLFSHLSGLFSHPSGSAVQAESAPGAIAWREFSRVVFEEARNAKKLIVLDLEAVWCHWCHVMDQKTYSDPAVQQILHEKYLAIKVDQDSRPDLANRYRDYGWPATIFFNDKGEEIEKRAGYIAPDEMAQLLEKLAKNPLAQRPGPASTLAPPSQLSAQLRADLEKRHTESLDTKKGGLNLAQRYLEADSVEFAMLRAARGNKGDEAWTKLTLTENLKLIDPVWGGVYQYSTHFGWEHPHFEKIVPTQSHNLRSYSFAYRSWADERFLLAANSVAKYVQSFLRSPAGGFYTSQDADLVQGEHAGDFFALGDAQRRERGIPRIDTNRYARENGLLISGLVALYEAAPNENLLTNALAGAEWVLEHRKLPGGGFAHGERDQAGPYLADSLTMSRAFLDLYRVTAQRRWLNLADETALWIERVFRDRSGTGFLTSISSATSPLPPAKLNDENIECARLLNFLAHYTGRMEHGAAAQSALLLLSDPQRALAYITEAGILLAARELGSTPLHLTIVAAKGDAAAAKLFRSALHYPESYKRLEWWDPAGEALANPDVFYPDLGQAAAYICTDKRCSAPVFNAADLPRVIGLLTQRR